jgi:hypothetical protein
MAGDCLEHKIYIESCGQNTDDCGHGGHRGTIAIDMGCGCRSFRGNHLPGPVGGVAGPARPFASSAALIPNSASGPHPTPMAQAVPGEATSPIRAVFVERAVPPVTPSSSPPAVANPVANASGNATPIPWQQVLYRHGSPQTRLHIWIQHNLMRLSPPRQMLRYWLTPPCYLPRPPPDCRPRRSRRRGTSYSPR